MIEQREQTYGKRYAWALVIVFTTLSVLLNAAHGYLGLEGESRVVITVGVCMSVVAPIALLCVTHLVVGLIRHWRVRKTWLVWLRGTAAAAAAMMAVFAFIASFDALVATTERMKIGGEPWMLPLVIDAMIVIATICVVIAETEMLLDATEVTDRAVTGEPVTLPAQPGIAEAEDQPEAVTAVVTGQWPVIEPVSPVVTEPVVAPVSGTSEPVGAVVTEAVDQADHSPDLRESTSTDQADRPDQEGDQASETTHGAVVTEVVTDTRTADRETGVADQADRAVVPDGVHDTAVLVCQELGSDVSPDVIAQALHLADQGVSRRRIADQLGIGSHNTVGRWLKAAASLQPDVLEVAKS